jgi:hypothetical protein
MKDNLKKANQSLLEGDRDGVLELLRNEPETPDAVWLRAHSVLSDDERIQLLSQLANGDSPYSSLARQFLEREKKFEKELSEPPDYQFWKQPTWGKKIEKMKSYRLWVVGGVLLLVLGIVGSVANSKYDAKFDTQVATAQAEQTARAALAGKSFAQYAEGIVSIIDIEDPVDTINRPVTFGEQLDENFKPAEPAKGARFVAVLISFQCTMAICSSPPEAELGLRLADGTSTPLVNYSSHPFFIDEPPSSEKDRLSNGRSTKIWFVFEVPRITSPQSLIVLSPNVEKPLIVVWPATR